MANHSPTVSAKEYGTTAPILSVLVSELTMNELEQSFKSNTKQ